MATTSPRCPGASRSQADGFPNRFSTSLVDSASTSSTPTATSSPSGRRRHQALTNVHRLGTALRDLLQTTLSDAYRLERELGGGGMSRVFVAEERALGRRVVVKVLSPDLAAGVNVERFNREILLTAQLQHPHIVPVFTAGETDGLPYYTMPFVEGESLRVRLMRTGAMPIATAVSILRDVARALEFAHDKGIVHRDIKPDNILLTGDTAAVADFGIAKALVASRVATGSTAMTALGVAIGTPQYMAPEQAAGDTALDHRADLYALGCVAYEMIAGEPPFSGRTALSLVRAHIVDTPTPIATKRADIPDALATLIGHCLEKDPDARPPGAHDIIEVLDISLPRKHGPQSHAATEVPTIAVLPFVSVSADKESDHFADGLTDEVITDLSMIKTLRVISRQSAMRLKGSDKDLRTLARELGARYVLTGSIRRAGTNLRITAQLVDAGRYAAVGRQVQRHARGRLRDPGAALSPDRRGATTPPHATEDRRLAQRPIGDVRAYEYYLLAREESGASHAIARPRAAARQARETSSATTSCCSWPRDSSIGSTSTWASCRVAVRRVSREGGSVRVKVFALNPESAKGHGLRGAIRHKRADPNGRPATTRGRWHSIPTIPTPCSGSGTTTACPDDLRWHARSWTVSSRWIRWRRSTWRCTGWSQCATEDYPEALTWTQRAVDIDPANPTVRMVRADAGVERASRRGHRTARRCGA